MQANNMDSVAIFWDYENCHASAQTSGYEIAAGIRNAAHRFGSVKCFKAYMETPDPDSFRSLSLRSELQSSGISLTDCPHNGRKNVADQMIMVDMLAFAMDQPPPATLILISGDRDFAYAVSILRLRRYQVVVISLPHAHISLRSQASLCLDWNVDVMGYPDSGYAENVSAQSPFRSPATRRPSSFGERESPFSAAKPEQPSGKTFVCNDPRPVHPSPSSPVKERSLEPPDGSPDVRDRPAAEPVCAPAPAYFANLPQTPKKNVGGAKIATPVASTSNSPSPCCGEGPGQVPVVIAASTALFTEDPISAHIQRCTETTVPVRPSEISSVLSPTPEAPAAASTSSTATSGKPVQQKLLPAFKPLVQALEKHKAKGVDRPLRSVVGYELVGLAKTVYQEAGAKNFSQLTALAEKAKIVQLGGSDGKAWISLHRDWSTSGWQAEG